MNGTFGKIYDIIIPGCYLNVTMRKAVSKDSSLSIRINYHVHTGNVITFLKTVTLFPSNKFYGSAYYQPLR
jgi:hypothetical protein